MMQKQPISKTFLITEQLNRQKKVFCNHSMNSDLTEHSTSVKILFRKQRILWNTISNSPFIDSSKNSEISSVLDEIIEVANMNSPSTSVNDSRNSSLRFLNGWRTSDSPLRYNRSNAYTHTCTLISEASASWRTKKRNHSSFENLNNIL